MHLKILMNKKQNDKELINRDKNEPKRMDRDTLLDIMVDIIKDVYRDNLPFEIENRKCKGK